LTAKPRAVARYVGGIHALIFKRRFYFFYKLRGALRDAHYFIKAY
jgi:hypothetical protein